MDKSTKKLALRIFQVREELQLILGYAFDNDYVTIADQKRLIGCITNLSNLDFIEFPSDTEVSYENN